MHVIKGGKTTMKKLLSLTASLLFLGLTTGLTLANPLVSGIEHGIKKGWFKSNKRP
jgi:hypothetical protein